MHCINVSKKYYGGTNEKISTYYAGSMLPSNLTLKFPEKHEILYEQFSSPSQLETYTNSVIFFDEMWKWADSRLSGSALNRFLSMFSIITRKNK